MNINWFWKERLQMNWKIPRDIFSSHVKTQKEIFNLWPHLRLPLRNCSPPINWIKKEREKPKKNFIWGNVIVVINHPRYVLCVFVVVFDMVLWIGQVFPSTISLNDRHTDIGINRKRRAEKRVDVFFLSLRKIEITHFHLSIRNGIE